MFVTPGYNFWPPPSLLNAVNYVYKEVELRALDHCQLWWRFQVAGVPHWRKRSR
ncbi:hypothetical protein [Nitrosospira sp. Is2]|uniref:hypothetical protein n=1 Tax=Nitrosospira sp. Is2 TaxID=3080532 RepID=UPI002954EF91|nr:hypothetical protein [Nitrosospira sp. Is2]WON75488.1 hypothetical protein R5L00_15015 [Nitrosospira sp. Is2]